jgi:hypothetical protein
METAEALTGACNHRYVANPNLDARSERNINKGIGEMRIGPDQENLTVPIMRRIGAHKAIAR